LPAFRHGKRIFLVEMSGGIRYKITIFFAG
jgi:hypothetical protein